MKIINTPEEMQKWAWAERLKGKSIGVVPTMGALHNGHKSLFERARKENDLVVATIYVNPAQFNNKEDLARYPKTFDADKAICETAGVDCIFAPANLYTPDSETWVIVEKLSNELEGVSRPGHFKGVTTVVTKLFNIIMPTRAYFGRKDAQQLVEIQTMVRDLNMPVEIVPCDTLREADGLAMSSRNRFLKPAEREAALCLSKALNYCRSEVDKGERNAEKLIGGMKKMLNGDVDYVAIVNAHDMTPLSQLKGDVLVAIALQLGTVRLIDNTHFQNLK